MLKTRYYSDKTWELLEQSSNTIEALLRSVEKDLSHYRATTQFPEPRVIAPMATFMREVRMMHIYHLHLSGMSNKEIAVVHGVTPPRISQILTEARRVYRDDEGSSV